MHHLAHEHEVHRLLAEGRRPRASDGARHAALARQPRGHPALLEAHGHEAQAVASGPARRHLRQVAQARADVGERQRGAGRNVGQHAGESVPHRRGAPEPAIGPGDVPERLRHGRGVGRRIVEQLDADGAPEQRLARAHDSAA